MIYYYIKKKYILENYSKKFLKLKNLKNVCLVLGQVKYFQKL